MTALQSETVQGLPLEQWEALQLYRLALRLHDGRYLVRPRVVAVPSPSAGSEWSTSVPAGTSWSVRAVIAKLTASAVVANRAPAVTLSDGTTTFARIGVSSVTSANNSTTYSLLHSLGYTQTSVGANNADSGWPSLPLFSGATIASSTAGLDVGDQWSQVALYVIETRERTANEMQAFAADVISGAHVDLYPGLLIGL